MCSDIYTKDKHTDMNALLFKQKRKMGGLYLPGLQKAFDSVSRRRLVKKQDLQTGKKGSLLYG